MTILFNLQLRHAYCKLFYEKECGKHINETFQKKISVKSPEIERRDRTEKCPPAQFTYSNSTWQTILQ